MNACSIKFQGLWTWKDCRFHAARLRILALLSWKVLYFLISNLCFIFLLNISFFILTVIRINHVMIMDQCITLGLYLFPWGNSLSIQRKIKREKNNVEVLCLFKHKVWDCWSEPGLPSKKRVSYTRNSPHPKPFKKMLCNLLFLDSWWHLCMYVWRIQAS